MVGQPKQEYLPAHAAPLLGRAGLETVDTLIMAGIADTRAEAIGWALARIRERPAFERLRERVREIDRLRKDF